jgi:ATP-dependent Clp protease ATP-binding subunit ClpB
VGYDEGGQLTEAVRRRPYGVLLLDEIEKAHADVFNVLLQLLDDGRLTDGQGRVVDFTNTVVIMTSNIGSHFLVDGIDPEIAEERVVGALREHFRPEFLNRVDEIVVFGRLTREQLGSIVELQAERLRRRLAERGIALEIDAAARELLAQAGFDPAYGARPLKRVVQRRIENPLAQRVLAGEVSAGDTVLVGADGDALTFTVADRGAQAPPAEQEPVEA